MHSSLSPAMDASLESKFSAAFEQQAFNQKATAAALAQLLSNGGFGPQPQLNKLVKQFPANASTPPPSQQSQHQPQQPSSYSHAIQSVPVQSQSLHNSSQQQSQNQTTSSHHHAASSTTSTTTTEVNGEKIISFRKEKDMDQCEELSAFAAEGVFTDLIVCCSGRIFRCHRVLLAAASTYIRDALAMFLNNDDLAGQTCNHCNTVIILPPEIEIADVELILRFVYEGHVEVKTAGLETFIRSARILAIKGLSNIKVAYNQDGSDADLVVADDEEKSSTSGRKNEFSRGQSLFSTANGINSPPPSPPNLANSSLASLKALAQNQSLVSTLAAAAVAQQQQQQQNGNKSMNGLSRSSLKGQSPRPDQVSLLNNANQQSTTSPRNFHNGLPFFNSAASQIVPPSTGSRRKAKKLPSTIANALQSGELNPFAAALYTHMLNNANATSDSDMKNDDDDKKFLNNEALSDSSTVVDIQAATLAEQFKQAGERLTLPFAHAAAQAAVAQAAAQQNPFPNQACMVEVDADPTMFTGFGDLNENIARLAAAASLNNGLVNSTSSPKNKKRKSAKQKSSLDADFSKKMKNAFGSGVPSSPDISMNPTSPLMNLGISSNALDFAKAKNEPLEMMFGNANQSNQGSNQGPAAGMSPGSGSFPPGFSGPKWKCEYCNKYYGNKQTLKEHMDYFHSNREEQIYICNICKKEYTWRKSLMKHYRDIHQMRNTPVLSEISRQLVALSKNGGTGGGSNSNQSQPSPASQDATSGGMNSSAAAAAAAVAAQSLASTLDAAQLESLVAQFKNQVAEDNELKGDDDNEVDLSMHLEQSMQVCEDEAASDEETEVNQSDVNPAESSGVDLSSPLGQATDDEKTPDSEASGADSAIDATGGDASPSSARSSSASA